MQQQSNSGGKQSQSLDYCAHGNGFDEVFSAEGVVNEHWQYLFDSLNLLGSQAIQERHVKAQRILRDDGATYNVYKQSGNKSQAWFLDPIPHVLRSEDWAGIESGLLERSELMNLLLRDIYGARDIIKYNLVPPELIYSHRGFLRPCHGVMLPGEHQLILHAVDMIRGQDGQMHVVSDRTQAPSGAGYALENRMVMSRIFPSLFRDSHVHRLALFFQALRHKLTDLSPGNNMPRIVVLTPGAYNETYFEHAYLANYLGFTLVQGGDLTVRDGFVWMKSLEGLRKVDVILRRVDDLYCDPVELRGDSHLGVPGLLEVMRAGRVVVANPLGSGVLENPALFKYLPEISRFFLGRDPKIPSVKTYWCAEAKDFDHVAKNFANMVIKPTYRKPGAYSILVSELDDKQRTELLATIKTSPHMYVGQEYVAPSQTPAWIDKSLVSRPAILRSFTVATHDSSYSVMPGGLTRIGGAADTTILTNQQGSESKDTWVIASEPEKQISLRSEGSGSAVEDDHSADLPSRVVENLFWMGRYAERAEAALRLLRSVFVRLNGFEYLSEVATQTLLRTVTHLTNTYPGFTVEDPGLFKSPEAELISVVLDEQRVGGITSSLLAMLTSAEEVKELLSADTQRVINDIGDELASLKLAFKNQMASAPEEALDPLVTALLALTGLGQESMIHGMGWRFMKMGRRFERAMQTIYLMRSTMVPALDESDEEVLLESVLLSVEGLITYRRRYRSEVNVESALDLVMLDESNPRSLIYQLNCLEQHMKELPAAISQKRLGGDQRAVLEAKTSLLLSDLKELAEPTPEKDKAIRHKLDQLLVRVQHLLIEGSGKVAEQYFDHTAGPQPITKSGWEL
ncbi:MAG: circularly permuted type 2 ATP-grasp protein [Pseudomonadales bacterium]|nr:circularly permuted type 2 ATP-grasp protein [Pseudomonadales bacterium]